MKGWWQHAKKKTQSSGNKPLPANQQKGKKVCTCCHEEKNQIVNGEENNNDYERTILCSLHK